jgi:lipopolysaccharide export system permease protein
MNILDRYVAKTVILASAMVIFAVLGLAFFIDLLGELRDIGTGDYNFFQALIHVALTLPHDIYQFIPMLLLLGGVLGLGMLSAHHELVVMRTSGLSVKQVIHAVMMAAVVLIIASTLIGELLAPKGMYLADKRKNSAENSGQAVATASGVWIHEGNNFLHIDRVVARSHLEGVKRYEFDEQHHLLAAYYAKTLDFESGKWQFNDLVKTLFKDDETRSYQVLTGVWNLKMNPNLLSVGMVEPEQLSLPKLSTYSRYLVQNGLQANRFQFEFWKRLFQPLTTLVMILLAVPFVFGSPRSTTMGLRTLFAVMIGFTFYMFNAFLGQFSVVFQVSPFIAALFPTLIFALVGYGLMWKLNY